MFLDRLAGPVGIGMESHQPLGLAAIGEPLAHDGRDNGPLVGPGGQHSLEFGPESETFDVLQQGVDALAALVLVDELEQLLEHARGGTRSGHELHDGALSDGLFVAGHGRIGLRLVEHGHAVAGRSGAHHLQKGESAPEIGDLPLDGFRREAVAGDLLQIFGSEHIVKFSGWSVHAGATLRLARLQRPHLRRTPPRMPHLRRGNVPSGPLAVTKDTK